MGISTYVLKDKLPKELNNALPSKDELERLLKGEEK
jgi:hypothetical protein